MPELQKFAQQKVRQAPDGTPLNEEHLNVAGFGGTNFQSSLRKKSYDNSCSRWKENISLLNDEGLGNKAKRVER